jgi:hypothetical protein
MYITTGTLHKGVTTIPSAYPSLTNGDRGVMVYLQFNAVLRIHNILVWIRVPGSLPLTNGSGFGSGSCYFRH